MKLIQWQCQGSHNCTSSLLASQFWVSVLPWSPRPVVLPWQATHL